MQLHQLCRRGDVKEARNEIEEIVSGSTSIFKQQQSLGLKDQFGITALHYAVKYGNFEIVKLLIEKKTDVNVTGKNGATPMHYVTCFTRGSDASMLQYLIRNGADVNAVDDFDCTPLHYSCNKGNIRVVKELTSTAGIEIEPKDQLKNTPLHNACSAVGSIEIVDILIENGADILCENEAESTPMHVACGQGHKDLLNHLLEIVEKKYGIAKLAHVLEQTNSEGQSLLHLAVLGSHLSIAKQLLERGCEVDSTMDGGETALHIAAVTGNKEIVDLLLKFQQTKSVDFQNDAGRTALHKSARFGKHNVVSLLLERGADVNCKDDDGISPLILASMISSNPETIKVLLDHNADVLVTDREDQTALHFAAIENNIEGVKTLLESPKCADIIDSKDKDSNTCLNISCSEGFEEIAILLMEKNANVKSRNNQDKTPLHSASFHGRDNVVDNIIDINSSTINDIDKDGNAPLHLAAQNGHSEVIRYLLKCGAAVDDKNANGLSPIDYAALNGHIEAAKALVWGGASLYQNEETGYTPLHHSCVEGHKEITEYLLEYCDVGTTTTHGRNALDLAIDNLNEDVARVILDHRDWKRGLRNKTIEDGVVMTPIRKMIKRMPDVAHHAFSRCISACDEYPIDHEEYVVTLTYEFIDDVYNNWPCDDVYMDSKEGGRGKGEKLTEEQLQEMMQKKDTHTFSHMIEHQRKELLLHPLVISCLNKKWQQFAAYLYYIKLTLYTLFLLFVTGYILVTAPMREPYRSSDCTIVDEGATWELIVFVKIGKYIVLLLAMLHLLFEVFQIIGQGHEYFEIDNLLEWTIYLLAIANVIDDFITIPFLDNGLVCGMYQKTLGATGLFLAWLNFVLFMRKVSGFGIYIVMFLYVIKTFFRFFTIFVFLIAAFGFSFCVLLQDHIDLKAFKNPFAALIKTLVMMTGEMGYDDIFYSENHDADIALWVIFVIFVLIMNIVLMNLLVGLAVDDIQAVQKEAEMTKATMQIDICLDSEKTLPKSLRRKFTVTEQAIFMNKDEPLPKNISEESFSEIKELMTDVKQPIDQVQDNLKSINTNLNRLDKRVEDMDGQVNEIATLNEKLDYLQVMIKDLLKSQKRKRKHKSDRKDGTQKKDGVPEADDTGTGDDFGGVDGDGGA